MGPGGEVKRRRSCARGMEDKQFRARVWGRYSCHLLGIVEKIDVDGTETADVAIVADMNDPG